MAKVIITFTELRASVALAGAIARAVEAHTGKTVSVKKIAEVNAFANKSDREVAEELRKAANDTDKDFIFVGSSDITIDLPVEFTTGYIAAYGKLADRVIPVGVQIYNAAKALKGIFKMFESDAVALCRDILGVKPIPADAKDKE